MLYALCLVIVLKLGVLWYAVNYSYITSKGHSLRVVPNLNTAY